MPDESPQQQPPAPPSAAAPPAPPAQQPATPPAPAPGADPNAALLSELAQLKAWRAQRELADSQAAEQKRLDEQRKLAEKGQIEELVKQHGQALEEERKRAAQTVERFKLSERNRELALALAGHNLVPGAAAQLAKLWADEFEVVEAGDTYQVRSRDLKSPKDWVAAKLGSEEYGHFVRATNQGGAGAAPATTPGNSLVARLPDGTAVNLPPGYVVPQTEGEKAYAEFLAQVAEQRRQGSAPIGLSFGPGFNPAALPAVSAQGTRPPFVH